MLFDELIDYVIETMKTPKVTRVISSKPATTILWDDHTKTTVKCMDTDNFDAEKGVLMALLTRIYSKKELKTILHSIEYEEEYIDKKGRKKHRIVTKQEEKK